MSCENCQWERRELSKVVLGKCYSIWEAFTYYTVKLWQKKAFTEKFSKRSWKSYYLKCLQYFNINQATCLWNWTFFSMNKNENLVSEVGSYTTVERPDQEVQRRKTNGWAGGAISWPWAHGSGRSREKAGGEVSCPNADCQRQAHEEGVLLSGAELEIQMEMRRTMLTREPVWRVVPESTRSLLSTGNPSNSSLHPMIRNIWWA